VQALPHPLCTITAFSLTTERHVRVAPAPWGKVHRIECWDYSELETRRLPYDGSLTRSLGLLQQASVELDEPISWHPALRASRAIRGERIPLAKLVRLGLPGATDGLRGVLHATLNARDLPRSCERRV
jgi:hypothetical protein